MLDFNVRAVLAASLSLAISSGAALAQDVGQTRVSVGASTVGITAEAAYRFNPNLSIRGVAGFIPSVSSDIELDGETYNVDVESFSGGAMLDWHTGVGGLRFSAGAFYVNPTVAGTSSTTGTNSITIGGTTYTSSGTITVNANVAPKNDVAPILSIGYDQPLGDRWVLSGEIGGILNGGYDVTATASSTDPNVTITQADVDAEAQNIENDINNSLSFLPYVSVMVGIRF